MEIHILLLGGWAAMAIMMVLALLWARAIKNYGLVDAFWALGLAISGLGYALLSPGLPARRLIVGLLSVGWSLRLAFYLYFNRVHGKPEDGRYKTLRNKWSENEGRNFFCFFQFQASWVVLFSLPFIAAMYSNAHLSFLDGLGILVWIIAVGGESLADWQLAQFRARQETRGQTCRDGLWNYTRHPNYFFEWIHWFSYIFLGWYSPHWYLVALGPVIMFVFLFKITGIPYTEKQALKSRGESYRLYQKTTSMFFPWFPGKSETEKSPH